jgi:NADPH:quinone reductase-like Zn-dependent oxidoreductase
MIYGTAGLTAGMSVLWLTESVLPDDGNIVVSGATGGVGSLCVAILNKLNYSVTAVTAKEQEKDFLLSLGAREIILRGNIFKRRAREGHPDASGKTEWLYNHQYESVVYGRCSFMNE